MLLVASAVVLIFILNLLIIRGKRKRGVLLSRLQKIYWVVGIVTAIVVAITGIFTLADIINHYLSSISGFQLPTPPTEPWVIAIILVISVTILVLVVGRKKLTEWFKRDTERITDEQLKTGLHVVGKPKAVSVLSDTPCIQITLHIWSSIHSILYPDRIIGKIETKAFESEIKWDKEGETMFKHIIGNIEPNKNSWMFHVSLSLTALMQNVSSDWFINFKVIFQDRASRTFNDLRFRIRDSDAKRLREA